MRFFRMALAFLAAGIIRVPGQDALRGALSLDPALAPRAETPVESSVPGPHLGPIPFGIGSYLRAQYNDNFFEAAVNPQTDVSLRAGINATVSWAPTERSELRFNIGAGYLHYIEHSAYSGVELAPDSALTYSVNYADTTLSAYDQFNYWREVATEGALANIATLPRLDNIVGARLSWEPDRWRLQAGYGHEVFLAENSGNDYLNRASEQLFARAAWRLAENSETGLEASGSFTAYQLHIQSDNRNFSVGPFLDWSLRPAIHLSLRGGPAFYFFDPVSGTRQGSDLVSYYASLTLSHQLTEYISHELNVRRDVQPGLNRGSDYIEQLSVSYGLSCALTPRISLAANLTYENGSQPLPLFTLGPFIIEAMEHFERVGGGPRFSWRATDKLTVSLDYSHWQRTSNFPGRDYGENAVGLSLGYAF